MDGCDNDVVHEYMSPDGTHKNKTQPTLQLAGTEMEVALHFKTT